MSWHNGHSARRPSRSCSAWAARRSSAGLFVRLRPLAPIIATFVLSLVYSMILFARLRRPRAPHPGRLTRSASSCPGRLRRRPGGARRAAGGLDPRPPRRRRSGSTGEHVSRRPTRACERRLSASSSSASSSILALSGLTARLFYLQIVNGGEYTTLATAQSHRRSSDPLAARPDLRPRRPALVTNVPDVRGQDPPVRPAAAAPRRGGRPARGAARHRPGRDQHRDRQQPGLTVRPRPDRPGRPRGHRPPHLRVRDELPGVEVVGRGAPRIHRRRRSWRRSSATPVRCRRAAPRPPARRATCPDDLLGKAGVEATYETELRGVYGSGDASSAMPWAGSTQVLPTVNEAQAGRLAHADDRHQDPEGRPEGPEVGHARRSASSAAWSS